MNNKRYYWLKLKDDFFEDDTIAWLEEQENGKDYVLFYLKLALKSLDDNGSLIRYVGERLIPYDVKALSKLTNTPVDTVAVAMKVFQEIGLVSTLETGEIYMNQIEEMIGSETRQASIMRKKRAKVNQIKELAEIEETHIPYIEDYINRRRYGGNYYNVFNRDEQKCVSCGSKSNLCVHHIIGFDETDNKTTQMGSMITLCRSCHSKEHANPRSIVSDEILGKIGFDFNLHKRIDSLMDTHGRSNNVTESYPDVKKCYTEIEIEIEKELELEKESTLSTSNEVDRVPYKEIVEYLNKKTDKNFRHGTQKTRSLIRARFNEGFSLEDFKSVIDIKTSEWLEDKEMNLYLRPETLFSNKFEGYLNQKGGNYETNDYTDIYNIPIL